MNDFGSDLRTIQAIKLSDLLSYEEISFVDDAINHCFDRGDADLSLYSKERILRRLAQNSDHVFRTGTALNRAFQKILNLPDEVYILM